MLRSGRRSRNNFAARGLASLILAGGLVSGLPAEEMVIDLAELGTVHPGFKIPGVRGRSVSGAGDINNDGYADFIVGTGDYKVLSWVCYCYVTRELGHVKVFFGRSNDNGDGLPWWRLTSFNVSSQPYDHQLGSSVSGSGDVNGDGLADVIVGAVRAQPGGRMMGGESYVVFGKTNRTAVGSLSLGTGGYPIGCVASQDYSGGSVSGCGDVNGDGLADLIVGAVGADPGGRSRAGQSYVVFGKPGAAPVDPSALGLGGFTIDGMSPDDNSGISVSGAGDVNGDGLADLIVGASGADPRGHLGAGESYVVFGKRDGAAIELAALGSSGFKIDGTSPGDNSGLSVSGAGDVNGDGLGDLIIGAPAAAPAGGSYVVFGKPDGSVVDLAVLGSGGFRIEGADAGDLSGWSVSGAGDVNGDGLADLVVGAIRAAPSGVSYAGRSYVVYGKTDSTTVELAGLGDGGFRMDGVGRMDLTGWSVSAAGDVNGDGLADVILGAKGSDDVSGYQSVGATYVIFSPATAPSSATYKATALAGDAPRVPIGISGDGSNDSTPDSRCWIDFADGSGPGLKGASIQTVELIRSDAGISGGLDTASTANVAWHVSTDRTGWTSAALRFRYTNAEINGLNERNLHLYSSASLAGPWSEVTNGFTANPGANTIGGTVSELDRFFVLVAEPSISRADFAATPDGWTFAVPTPPFSATMEGSHSVASGALVSTTHENSNSFGFWESPLIPLSPIAVGEELLYQATFTVASDLADRSLAPTMRLRLSTSDFQRSDILTVTSIGTGEFSPGTAPRDYTALTYGSLEQLRLDFDMINVDPSDAANASFALQGARLDLLNVGGLGQEGTSTVLDLTTDASAWTTAYDGTGAIAAPVEFLAAEDGLLIRGESPAVARDVPVLFGFWNTAIPAPGNIESLYRVRWTVGSDATSHTAVPTFRLRVNDASLQFGSLVVIDSPSNAARVPIAGQDEMYDQWFLLPSTVAGNDWLLSFDYLYADTSANDDPTTGLWLRRVEINKYR
jgi:hypothetical protein